MKSIIKITILLISLLKISHIQSMDNTEEKSDTPQNNRNVTREQLKIETNAFINKHNTGTALTAGITTAIATAAGSRFASRRVFSLISTRFLNKHRKPNPLYQRNPFARMPDITESGDIMQTIILGPPLLILAALQQKYVYTPTGEKLLSKINFAKKYTNKSTATLACIAGLMTYKYFKNKSKS